MHRFGRNITTGTLCLLTILGLSTSASALDSGDIALISFASDTPDSLAFVVLREVPASTTIRFTDSGWQAGGGFRANEGGIEYTTSSTLAPGTVISRSAPFDSGGWSVSNAGVGANGLALSSSGDQIIAFAGAAESPTFIHAVHFDSTGFVDATSSNTTALPAGLVEGETAVNLDETDNGYYNGPTNGTPGELLSAIGDPLNWSMSDTPITPPVWNFSVGDAGPQLIDIILEDVSFGIGELTTITVQLASTPAPGSPVSVEIASGAFATQTVMIANPDTQGVANVSMANEGVWTVLATATLNGTGQVESDTFTVGSPMIPPVAHAGPDHNVELTGSVVQVALTGAFGDDADGLVGADYEWTKIATAGLVGWLNRSGPLNSTSAPASTVVTFDSAGVYVLTLTVADADGLIATDSTTVTVTSPAPIDDFDAPTGYYSAATGQGGTLKSQLSQIITSGHVQQSYGDFKTGAARYDEDPNVPGNILLAYNRASVPANWDGGSTWNREHVWPQSRQPGDASDGTKGNLGDPHALRPANPSINSSRNNKPFGTISASGLNGHDGSYYFPGDVEKGDIARSQFYSATRYMSTLTLVNGIPSGNQMGDLNSMVRWHYTDVPDFFERRRNQRVFEDQHNRSPFVDHPEFVWSVFGDGANDSTLYVSPTEPIDGASTELLVFPPIIVNGPLPPATTVTLNKAGNDPTYYAVTPTGDATSSITGRFNAFDFGSQQLNFSVGISGNSIFAGKRNGSVVIDNLDISSEGFGQGASDGNDIVTVSLTVLDHSEASFASDIDDDTLLIDFGSVPPAAGLQTQTFTIHNLEAASGLTADLDLVQVTPTGDDDVLTTDAVSFSGLVAGGSATFHAQIDPSLHSAGTYSASYGFDVADENLPGSTLGSGLTLTLTGTVSAANFPFDDDGDADVDDLDAANYIDCMSGPDGGWIQLLCANHDADADGDVDLMDAAQLQLEFSGTLP